jgi:CMP-N-acetylneuraminic acid synthetase
VDDATEHLARHPEADSVRSVSIPREHPYRVFRVNAEGYLAAIMAHEHPTPALLRRQDQPLMYHYNCVVDVTRPRTILGLQSMTGARMLPLILPRDHVFDVDTPLDLQITRAFMEGRL